MPLKCSQHHTSKYFLNFFHFYLQPSEVDMICYIECMRKGLPWWLKMVKNLPAMQETRVRSLGWEDPREKGMATHSSILASGISWTEEPGGLTVHGSQRAGHNWVTEQQQCMRDLRFKEVTCLRPSSNYMAEAKFGAGARFWLHPSLLFAKPVWPSRFTMAFVFIHWSIVDLTVAFVKMWIPRLCTRFIESGSLGPRSICRLARPWEYICLPGMSHPQPGDSYDMIHLEKLSTGQYFLALVSHCVLCGAPLPGSPTKCPQLGFMAH